MAHIFGMARDPVDLLPEGFTHEGSPNGVFRIETDIMDVWFDSGSSHEAVLRQRDDLTFLPTCT